MAKVEFALLRNPAGVGDGLGVAAEDFLHPVRGLQAQVVVGLDEGQGLLDGDVALRCRQRVLEPVAVPGVVVDVVGGGQGYARAPGQLRQFPVAGGVALQEILLEFHVHPVRAVPFPVSPEQLAGVLAAALRKQLGKGPVPAPGEQHHTPGVLGQASRVQPGFPTVGGVGQGEQAGDVGVALTGPGQQHQAGAAFQGQFAAGDGPYAQAFGQPGEFQRPAQVGVGQGQGGIPVLHGLGQQLVDVGGPLSKGVEALDVEFHVSGCHGRSPGL